MNNSILIIDKRSREVALITKLSKAISNIGDNTLQAISLLHYNFEHKQYERLVSSDPDQWQKIEQPVQVSVRLRHDSDMEPADMPRGLLSIRYSGYSGGMPNQTHDTLGYERGIPYGISSKKEEAEKEFPDQWASELVQYLISGDVPKFLTNRTFNTKLENVLLEKISTFSPTDVSYRRLNKANEEGDVIEIAPFQSDIFHIFPSNSLTEKLDEKIIEIEKKIEKYKNKLTEIKDNNEYKEIEREINDLMKNLAKKEDERIEEIKNKRNHDFIRPNLQGLDLKFHFTSPLKVLIIWPGNINRQKVLSNLGGPSFHYRHEAFSTVTMVETKEDLNSLVDLKEYDLVILPAELRWSDGQHLTDLYGINVASQLRLRNFAGIIILTSMAPSYIAYHLQKETIKKMDEADHKGRSQDLEVLNMGFTYIWDISSNADGGISLLPENIKEDSKSAWNTLQKDQENEAEALINHSYGHRMSAGRLADVQYSLLPAGKLSAIIHEYRRVTQDTKAIELIIKAAKNALAAIEYIVEPFNIAEFKTLAEEILQKIEGQMSDLEAARGVLSLYREKLASFLPPDEDKSGLEQKTDGKKKAPWGVLLLEDDEDAAGQVKELLKRYQIPIWHTRNAIEAIKLLSKDYAGELQGQSYAANFIRVVLADIRLQNLTQESSRWDIIQGYEFVDKVNNTIPNFVTPIILTQQEQRMIRRSSAINPIWFPKSILRGEGNQELFMEKVLELGEQKTPPIPDSELWRNGYRHIHQYPFAVYYKQYRMSAEYFNHEQWVNDVAHLFFKLWYYSQQEEQNNQIALIQETLRNHFRNINIKDGITSNLRQERKLPLFRAKLATRRAALTIGEYSTERDTSMLEIDEEIRQLQIEFDPLIQLNKLIKELQKEIDEAPKKIKRINSDIEEIKNKSNEFTIEGYKSDIKYWESERDRLNGDIQKLIKRKNSYRDRINPEEKREYERRIISLQDEKKMFLNDVVYKILFLVRNFRMPILEEMGDDIDRTLLNRHLGLDSKPHKWCVENNLILEENAWLQSMRESGWGVANPV